MKNRDRIGIFGGSFDPIHIGHLRFAEIARELFDLNKVIFIPTYRLPHTYKRDISDYKFRFGITEKAIYDNRYFEISDIECEREERSYTIDTLRIFKERWPDMEIFFLMGSDSFEKIETWKEWKSLLKEFRHIIAVRPGNDEKKVYDFLKSHKLDYKIVENRRAEIDCEKSNINILRAKSLINVSSTEIRDFIKQNRTIKYLVNESILKNIIEYYKEV